MNRAEYLAKNVKFTMAGELLLAVLKFVSRRVFVLLLGKEYLGLNGLFTDVLSMLSVAELGFGVSITYSLYRPVACGDTNTVKSLMQLYRRIYRMVGAAVLAAGLTLTPFLDFFVKEMPENIPHIPLIYILNLLNTSISYFFIYKSTLLYVHQKKYVETAIRAGVTLAATGAQIAVLLLTGNYLYYLLLSIGATLVQNTVISVKANRLFPYLREKDGSPLPGETMEEIRRNVVYNSNISLEKLVVEKLVEGPMAEGAYPTINPTTKIVSVTVKDGTCYVNLNNDFLNQPYNVASDVTIYSITNSLAELSNVNRVQISINGETNISYRENMSLNNVFERNLDILE